MSSGERFWFKGGRAPGSLLPASVFSDAREHEEEYGDGNKGQIYADAGAGVTADRYAAQQEAGADSQSNGKNTGYDFQDAGSLKGLGASDGEGGIIDDFLQRSFYHGDKNDGKKENKDNPAQADQNKVFVAQKHLGGQRTSVNGDGLSYFRREFRNIFRHKGDHAGGGSQGHGNKDHEPENDCGKNIKKFSTAFHDNYLLPK